MKAFSSVYRYFLKVVVIGSTSNYVCRIGTLWLCYKHVENIITKYWNIPASIVSVNIIILSYGLFSDKPKPYLIQVNDKNLGVSGTVAGNSKTVSLEFLSKVFIIDVSLATKDLDQNTQLR